MLLKHYSLTENILHTEDTVGKDHGNLLMEGQVIVVGMNEKSVGTAIFLESPKVVLHVYCHVSVPFPYCSLSLLCVHPLYLLSSLTLTQLRHLSYYQY